MDMLKKGCQGKSVAVLQDILRKHGFPVHNDGIFGRQTYLAVCLLQQKFGLTADGIVGKNTWNAINVFARPQAAPPAPPAPSPAPSDPSPAPPAPSADTLDYSSVARLLNVDEAAVRAVCEIESGGRTGFLNDGRPIILFEGHIFWRELLKRGIDPELYRAEYGDVLFPKWDRTKYKGGAAEHDRLDRASEINPDAALASSSWGMFQIMGFCYKLCGYDSVRSFVDAIRASSASHLLSFARFLKNSGIDKPLQKLDWEAFAERYNGPEFRKNRYDVKLRQAYLKYKNK
jgi:hypothetical protein